MAPQMAAQPRPTRLLLSLSPIKGEGELISLSA
jgi:hypothetical protein